MGKYKEEWLNDVDAKELLRGDKVNIVLAEAKDSLKTLIENSVHIDRKANTALNITIALLTILFGYYIVEWQKDNFDLIIPLTVFGIFLFIAAIIFFLSLVPRKEFTTGYSPKILLWKGSKEIYKGKDGKKLVANIFMKYQERIEKVRDGNKKRAVSLFIGELIFILAPLSFVITYLIVRE